MWGSDGGGIAASPQGILFADEGTVRKGLNNLKSSSQMIALIGAAALFSGVFAPLISLPFIGSINYFRNGKGDGIIILGLAVISAGLAFRRKFRFIWYTASGSAAVMIFTFVNFTLTTTEIAADMRDSLAGNPFSVIGEIALASTELQWGVGRPRLGHRIAFHRSPP